MKSFKVEKQLQNRPMMLGLPNSLAWVWLSVSVLIILMSVFATAVVGFVAFILAGAIIGLLYGVLKFLDTTDFISKFMASLEFFPDELENDRVVDETK